MPHGVIIGIQVVFGKVADGYSVVEAIEAVGSQGGSTSAEVTIAKSGEVEWSGAPKGEE